MFTIIPYFLFPEFLMAISAFCVFISGLFLKKDQYKYLLILAVLMMIGLAIMIWMNLFVAPNRPFFLLDPLAFWGRFLGIISYAVCLLFFLYRQEPHLEKHECITLMLLSCTGMGIALCSSDLLVTYVGMELQALPIMIMIALQRSQRSSEAALKYFFLNGFSSACFLFGMALLYFLTGGTTFSLLHTLEPSSLGNMTVLLLILASLLFKVGATPFHFWVPDTWQGAPLAMTALLATGSKVFSIFILARFIVYGLDVEHVDVLSTFFTIIALSTMLWGAVAALRQENIKRLLAFASISHTGYLLAVLSQGAIGTGAMALYLLVYIIASLGIFSILIWMQQSSEKAFTNLTQFKGLIEQKPLLAIGMTILLFSLAGMPPTLGFIGKFFIFHTLLWDGAYLLAIVGVMATAISMAYYLKIIKTITMDSFDEKISYYLKNRKVPLIACVCCAMTALLLPLAGLLPIDWFTGVLSSP